jgi:hypothetical protein
MLGQSRGAVLGEFLGKTELPTSGVVLFGGRGHHGAEQGSLDRISRASSDRVVVADLHCRVRLHSLDA